MERAIREERFKEDIQTCEELIHKVCRIYCRDEEDRKDLFQEILVQLWKSYTLFRGESKWSTWVYRIALNTSITQRRKNSTSVPILDTASLPEISDKSHENSEDQYKEMYRAIDQLNETEKAIMMLFLEDKGYDEMEIILGISQGALRVKMHRIKEKLRTLTKS